MKQSFKEALTEVYKAAYNKAYDICVAHNEKPYIKEDLNWHPLRSMQLTAIKWELQRVLIGLKINKTHCIK